MSVTQRFASHADAVKAGWFSRRHENSDAHRAAQDTWRERQAVKAELVHEQQARTYERKRAVTR